MENEPSFVHVMTHVRHQAIARTNDDIVHGHIYASSASLNWFITPAYYSTHVTRIEMPKQNKKTNKQINKQKIMTTRIRMAENDFNDSKMSRKLILTTNAQFVNNLP